MQNKYLRVGVSRWTKMFVAFIAGSLMLTSCSKSDDAPAPVEVSFEKATYEIPVSGEFTVTVTANKNVTENVTVPVNFGGTAVKGTDYVVSAEAVTLVAGSNTASFTVNVNPAFDREKSIRFEIGTLPSGLQKGNVSSAVAGISDGSVLIYSFTSATNNMTETAEIGLELKTISGFYTAEQEIRIPVAVAEGSTAVLGEHFTFEGQPEVVIPVGKSSGIVKLNYLKQEAGKDVIILKIGDVSSHYVAGNNETTRVVVFGPLFNQLKGRWKYKAMTNYDWWVTNMSYAGDFTNMPRGNAQTDYLTFSDEGLTTALESALKTYFRSGALTYIKEEDERLQEVAGFPKVKILVVNALANVAFSATTVNERQAEIGFRVFIDGGEEILEVTLRDYEPTDASNPLTSIYNDFKDYSTPGEPVMKYMPLRYHFVKVN